MVRENSLEASGFHEWFFYPGMLFNEMDKWWGNGGRRDKPHEGVDFCFYKNREKKIFLLDEKTKIPSLYDGVVIRVMEDFIGQSVVLEHHHTAHDRSRLFTLYGHTIPLPHLTSGRAVKEGEILATLARPGKASSNIPPHLHLSVGWILDGISFRDLDWDSIGTTSALKWVDPLKVI